MAGSKPHWRNRDDAPRVPYHEQVAAKLIEQLQAGTAPWQKPWEPGSLSLPHNPVSGTRYRGGNSMWLQMQGRADPRWMTYKQAQSVGAQVCRGEKGTLVQYWKFSDRVPVKDERGKPVRDGEGNKIYRTIELDKPKVFSASVFNAEQIDGLPPLAPVAVAWDRHERAEAILAASGAEIRHDQADRAFYRPATDRIHLPGRDSFKTADAYYATALHELGHWTGHVSRLDRDLAHPFGSEGYAKEELRAEIASLMIGEALGIGHDPGQHAAYVGSWIKALQDDPKEILRAARDADRIADSVLALEKERHQAAESVRPTPAVSVPVLVTEGKGADAPLPIPAGVRGRLDTLLSVPLEAAVRIAQVRDSLGTRYAAEVWLDQRPKVASAYQRISDALGGISGVAEAESARRYLAERIPSSYVNKDEAAYFGERSADLPSPDWARAKAPAHLLETAKAHAKPVAGNQPKASEERLPSERSRTAVATRARAAGGRER